MFYIRACLLVIVLFFFPSLRGQDNFVAYWQPATSINYMVAPGYQHNFSLTNRSYAYRDNQWDLSGRQLDLAHFSTWKFVDNQSVGFGLQYRFRKWFEPDRGNELRLTQQFNYTRKPFATRFGQRLRAEQRIFKSRTIHRFRYRFALDRPLMGEKLDVGEPYLVATGEILLSVGNAQIPQWDHRLGFNAGWLITSGTKLQAGIEYRMEDFSNLATDVFFLNTTLVLSL